jgi:hypothetical protein
MSLKWKATSSSGKENKALRTTSPQGTSLSLWGRRIAWFSIPAFVSLLSNSKVFCSLVSWVILVIAL